MKSNLFMKQLIGTLFFFAIIFLSAGKISYLQGWVYVVIGLVMILLN